MAEADSFEQGEQVRVEGAMHVHVCCRVEEPVSPQDLGGQVIVFKGVYDQRVEIGSVAYGR